MENPDNKYVMVDVFTADEVKGIIQNIYSEFAELPLHMHTTSHLKRVIEQEVEMRPIKPLKIFK